VKLVVTGELAPIGWHLADAQVAGGREILIVGDLPRITGKRMFGSANVSGHICDLASLGIIFRAQCSALLATTGADTAGRNQN
jgi:hypothetical protein